MAMANHTAWRVASEAELLDWQRRLESHGVNVSQFVQHEIIESIYFRDPDGHSLEFIALLNETPDPSFNGSFSAWKMRAQGDQANATSGRK